MVDLKSQYEKIKHEIDEAVINCLSSTAYINGPEVKNFQANLENYLQHQARYSVRQRHGRIADCDDGTWI